MATLPSREPVDLLHAPSLTAIPWLRHAFSARAGGVSTVYGRPTDPNLGLTPHDDPTAVHENRRRLADATANESWPLLTARQTHSTLIHTITALPHSLIEADALTTAIPGVFLGILTADCVPILLADTRLRVIAAVHAGWRGTAARILEQTIQTLRDRHHSRPEDLRAAIGPSIGPCCYQVGEELRTHFADDLFQEDRLDLWLANRRQLLAAGLRPTQLETLAQCTACARTPTGGRRFFSHRAEHGHTGRMMSLLGIAPGQSIR